MVSLSSQCSNLLTSRSFQCHQLFHIAEAFRASLKKDPASLSHLLKGYVLANVFYEVSTRTACSFAAAMLRLGGSVISIDSQSSSVQKGETLEGKNCWAFS